MYAIIATGGKQYRVSEGDVIYIEKIDAQVDSTVSFDVLLMGNDGDVKIGTPVVEASRSRARSSARGSAARRSSSTSTSPRRTIAVSRAIASRNKG